MALGKKKRLGDMLVEEGAITQEQLDKALKSSKETGKRLGEALVESGAISDVDIMSTLSKQLGIQAVSLIGIQIPEELLKLLSASILRKDRMVPIGFYNGNPGVVELAMADPMDLAAIDDFAMATGLQSEPVLALSREIMVTLDRYYGNNETLEAANKYAAERKKVEEEKREENDDGDLNDSPIVKLVRSMIEQAARQRTSDIHVEALERMVRVRYRIDGSLYERASYDIHLLPAIIARLKIIGGMDISEKRKPQDGRITMTVDHTEYDIRASILPTVYGEKCVMRLAQKKMLTRDKSALGFTPEELKKFVPNVKINVFDIAWLTKKQVGMFKSDFRIVADYFGQIRKTGQYKGSLDDIKHVYEVLELLSVMEEDDRYKKAFYYNNVEGPLHL